MGGGVLGAVAESGSSGSTVSVWPVLDAGVSTILAGVEFDVSTSAVSTSLTLEGGGSAVSAAIVFEPASFADIVLAESAVAVTPGVADDAAAGGSVTIALELSSVYLKNLAFVDVIV